MRIKFSRGFTLLDLLVLISIVTILGALLFPVYLAKKESARRELCLSRIKHLGNAAMLYSVDWDGLLPPYGSKSMPNTNMQSFRHALESYVKVSSSWTCPRDRGYSGGGMTIEPSYAAVYGTSYLFNSTIYILALPPHTPKKLNACRSNDKLVLYWDRVFHPKEMFWVQNVVYGDGHVDGLNKSQLRYQVEEVTKNLWGRQKNTAPTRENDPGH